MRWLDWLVSWFVPPAPSPVPPPVRGPLPGPGEIVAALNRARSSTGFNFFAMLVEDPQLDAVAARRALDLAARGVLDHSGFAVDIREALPAARGEGECLALGDLTAESLISLWLGDPPHRAIVLGPYDRVGCGVAVGASGVPYWVADFARLSR